MRLATLFLLLFLASCLRTQENPEDSAPLSSLPPRNLERSLECSIQDNPNDRFVLLGEERQYLSANDIDLSRENWEERLPADWSALDESVLGLEGINVDNAEVNPDDVRENARIAAVDVRRVNGELKYFYLSNGTAFHPIEQWSSTKILAVLLAGEKIREASQGRVGLRSKVSGKWIGDHITSIGRVSNNATSAWFKTIMGSEEMTQVLGQWINKSTYAPDSQEATIDEEFRGAYGTTPASHGGSSPRFVGADGASVEIQRDNEFEGDNTLSPLTLLESWKRVALADDADSARTLRLTDEDRDALFYGEPDNNNFGGFLVGGTKEFMVRAFGGKSLLDQKTGGKWRFFGKTGSGFSYIRLRHEGAFLVSVCLPAAPGGLSEGRLLLFHVNVQAMSPSRRSELREAVIARLAHAMVPELFVSHEQKRP